jgi:CBS-domain-containing membrane protein
MLIKEIMNTTVSECTEDTPLAEVYELTQSGTNRYAVVTDGPLHRRPLGIVNEHSICEALVKNRLRDRDLSAGSLMSTRIQKVDGDTDINECKWLLTSAAEAIVVVGPKRQFLGVLEPIDLRHAIKADHSQTRSTSVLAGMLGQAIPASVELPAFGWLK